EVVEEAPGGALEVVSGLVDAVVAEELLRLAEVDGVGREADPDPDRRVGDAPGGGAAVVSGERHARRRVRVLRDLPRPVGAGCDCAERRSGGAVAPGVTAGGAVAALPGDAPDRGRTAGPGRGRPAVRRR